jgi:hypothetical protein
MEFNKLVDTSKTLRVWWNSNGNVTHYYIDEIDEAKVILNVLAVREMDDTTIVFNASGVEVLDEDNEWVEWYSDWGLDVEEYFETR